MRWSDAGAKTSSSKSWPKAAFMAALISFEFAVAGIERVKDRNQILSIRLNAFLVAGHNRLTYSWPLDLYGNRAICSKRPTET